MCRPASPPALQAQGIIEELFCDHLYVSSAELQRRHHSQNNAERRKAVEEARRNGWVRHSVRDESEGDGAAKANKASGGQSSKLAVAPFQKVSSLRG